VIVKMSRAFLYLLLLCGAAASMGGASRSPNIVLIMADDLGWMDINPTAEYATGTPPKKQFYETPHLNELAKDGISFSRCYSMPLCTPSRATIITGRNGATFGFNHAAGMRGGKFTFAATGKTPPGDYLPHDKLPGTSPRFPVATATGNYALPNGMPDSKGQKVYSLAEMLPDYRSAFLGKWHIGGNNIEGHRPQDFGFEAITYEDEGYSHYRQNIRKRWHCPGPPAQEDYLTDDLTALSVDWIRNHVEENPKQPFLLYLAHFAVHDPFQARPEDVAHFEAKKTRGWNDHDNPTYAGMIKALDDSIGTIRAALEKLKIDDETVIIFTSDNGGQVEKKGVHVTSNAPLRGQKAQTFEGGIRVPMIVHAPGQKGKGRWVDTPVTLEDVAPTLAALGRQQVSEKIKKQWTGKSLVPLLQQRPADFVKRPIFIHEPYYRPDYLGDSSQMLTPSSVIIEGDYKLIAHHDGTMRLFDLSKDISESSDLSDAMPERTERMKKALAKWRFENIPARYDTAANPRYNPQDENALPAPQGPLFVR
jgi:arylsulfatase A-like enzyme